MALLVMFQLTLYYSSQNKLKLLMTENSLFLEVPSIQFSSVPELSLTLCDPMDCSTPGLPVHHQLLEFTQTYVH